MNTHCLKKKNYTLMELLAAMGVFSIIMLVIMQFFNSSQKIWIDSEKKTNIYTDARVALDLMATEIQCMLYNNDSIPQSSGIYPLWYKKDADLRFISVTPLKPSVATSNICEIRYALADGSNDYKIGVNPASEGTLLRSCTGDNSIAALYNFSTLPYGSSITPSTRVSNIFDNTSSTEYMEVINYVVSLKFYLLGSNGTIISTEPIPTKAGTPMPYLIKIELELLDKDSWTKWKTFGTSDFKNRYSRKFTRTIFLGDRKSN